MLTHETSEQAMTRLYVDYDPTIVEGTIKSHLHRARAQFQKLYVA